MKYKIISIVLVLLLCFFVIFLRIYAITLPNLTSIAKAEVYEEYLSKIKDKINKEYVNIPQYKKDKLAYKEYSRYLRQNKRIVSEKIKEKAKERKAFYQNDKNHTYIMGIDSYYWLRLIDNLRKKGRICDKGENGQNYDNLVGVPIEQSLSKSLHLYIGNFIYKIFDSIKLDVDYEAGLYLISLLFSALLAAITFYTTKLLSKSNAAAFFAGLTVNFSPLLLKRTIGEWLDTDIYNVFFPLLIFGAFLYVFKSKSKVKKSLGLAVFALACALYAGIWQGWWHIFDLLILCGLVFILNDYFSESNDQNLFKKNILWLSLLFLSGIFCVGLFNGKESFFSFISEPRKLLFTLKSVPKDSWPNVFLTVAELKKVSPYRITQELGGVAIFFISILGSIYLLLREKILRDKELGIGFFCLFIWLGALYYASLSAIRFALLLIVPLGIIFGIIFDWLICRAFIMSLRFSKKIHFLAIGILTIITYFFIASTVTTSLEIASYSLPMMNDAWYKSLIFIRDNSKEDTIINSWWDYGHWYTAISGKRVLFDGKTQNSPVAYWMAKAIITDDEQEVVGIIRMLNISKNKVFDLLKSYGFGNVKAINIIKDTLKLSKEGAAEYLKNILDKEKTDELMPLLYSDNMPLSYFIASYDIVGGKMRPVSHIGNWDFKKADIWINFLTKSPQEFIDFLQKEYGYEKGEISRMLKELILLKEQEALGWISKSNAVYMNSLSKKFKKNNNLIIFDNDLILDLSNYNAYILRGKNVDIGIPYSVVYAKDGVLEEKKLENSNLEYSVLLFKENDDADSYKSIFIDKDLVKSIFVRMYFLKGQTLKYFKIASEQKTPEDNFVYVYKIDWPK